MQALSAINTPTPRKGNVPGCKKIFSKVKNPSDFIPKGNRQSKYSITILGEKIKQFLFHFFHAFRHRAVSFITAAFICCLYLAGAQNVVIHIRNFFIHINGRKFNLRMCIFINDKYLMCEALSHPADFIKVENDFLE